MSQEVAPPPERKRYAPVRSLSAGAPRTPAADNETPPLGDKARRMIEAWLDHIEETDPAIRDEMLALAENNPEQRKNLLQQAKTELPLDWDQQVFSWLEHENQAEVARLNALSDLA